MTVIISRLLLLVAKKNACTVGPRTRKLAHDAGMGTFFESAALQTSKSAALRASVLRTCLRCSASALQHCASPLQRCTAALKKQALQWKPKNTSAAAQHCSGTKVCLKNRPEKLENMFFLVNL
jgi:hypothetical protein